MSDIGGSSPDSLSMAYVRMELMLQNAIPPNRDIVCCASNSSNKLEATKSIYMVQHPMSAGSGSVT